MLIKRTKSASKVIINPGEKLRIISNLIKEGLENEEIVDETGYTLQAVKWNVSHLMGLYSVYSRLRLIVALQREAEKHDR